MSLLGVQLTLLLGKETPTPAPPWLLESLDTVEVKHSDETASGFSVTFQAGRSGSVDLQDFKMLLDPVLRIGNRVVITVTFNARSRVLMDGLIDDQELAPGQEPGDATFTVKGRDLTVAMERESRIAEHPGLNDDDIVRELIRRYATYGLVAQVVKPDRVETPDPNERVPVQRCSDVDYVKALAKRHGHVFYLKPGPKPLTTTAYWGPPVRNTTHQKALSVKLGGETNVQSLRFRIDGTQAVRVRGHVQDPDVNQSQDVSTRTSKRRPALAKYPLLNSEKITREERLAPVPGQRHSWARTAAQSRTDASTDKVLKAEGELDAVRYGDVLEARSLVGVRGAGWSFDGLYYVQEVTHTLRKGEYKQRFTLTREGYGSTVEVVPV